jgi:hypothetical protein
MRRFGVPDQQDASAIDEAEQFASDNISTVGYMDDEEPQARPPTTIMSVVSSNRKGRQKRK